MPRSMTQEFSSQGYPKFGTRQITVSSVEERDRIAEALKGEQWRVEIETESETQLALPRGVTRHDVAPVMVGSLCCIVPGIVYLSMLALGPQRRIVITVA